MNVEAEIADVMRACGMTSPDHILFDGSIHRFGKKKSSWYVFFDGGVIAGAFGDWKLGVTEKFTELGNRITAMDRRRIGQAMKQSALQRQKELEKEQEKAASIVNTYWSSAKPVTEHPYLTRKKVPAYRLRVAGDSLLIPVTDGERIHSLQSISPSGEKRFYPGGKVQGHFYPIGLPEKPNDLYICEGIATGLTIYRLENVPVIVAFNAKNLVPVAETMRWRYPNCAIVIAGDNDHATPGNPGETAAELAAIRSGSGWITPNFTGLPFTAQDTDYNDLAILRGDL